MITRIISKIPKNIFYSIVYPIYFNVRKLMVIFFYPIYLRLKNGIVLKYRKSKNDEFSEISVTYKNKDFHFNVMSDFLWEVPYVLREIFNVYLKYYFPKKGDTIIDCGGNIGLFTVFASEFVGETGKVIVIEPEKRNLDFLQENIKKNNLKNIEIIKKGVWDKKEVLELNILSENPGGHTVIKNPSFNATKTSQIEVDSLDNILKELNINKVDFVKMDIEGAEIQALKGMEEVMQKNDSLQVMIAAYHMVDNEFTYKLVIPFLKKRGFEVVHEGLGFISARKI